MGIYFEFNVKIVYIFVPILAIYDTLDHLLNNKKQFCTDMILFSFLHS